MLQGAVIVFVIGALGGVGLASFVLRGQLAMWPLSMLHALVGATGLVLTALVVFGHGEPVPPYAGLALLILLLTALGGFFLASYHHRNQPGPRSVVLFHAAAAIVGVSLLAAGAFHLV